MSGKTRAKPVAERVAKYREKQRAAGMATLSLVVPEEDAAWFREVAAERRALHAKTVSGGEAAGAGRPTPPVMPSQGAETGGGASRAEVIADQIFHRIVDLGWPEGQSLGTEAELMDLYRVSRTVLRQAIRILQQLSIARMHRGTRGGLIVTRPEPEATVQAVNVMLEYLGIRAEDIYETRKLLESAAVVRATRKLDDGARTRLEAVVAAGADLDGNSHVDDLQRFHIVLGDLSGDPALALFIRIILKITDSHSTFRVRPLNDRNAVVARIKRYHRTIADEMLAGNEGAAVEQIEKYINGLIRWMR